jgi:predicted esterase
MLSLLAGLPVRAADAPKADSYVLLFFEDGYAVQGNVKREFKREIDPEAGAIDMPSGFFYLDDGPRRIYFRPQYAKLVDKKERPNEERAVNPKAVEIVARAATMAPILKLEWNQDFNEKWERKVVIDTTAGRLKPLTQRVGYLSPYMLRAEATTIFKWSAFYLTREFSPETVRRMLSTHPRFEEKKGLADAEIVARRFRWVDFFVQAGWYEDADRELDGIINDLPAQKDKAEATKGAVARIRNREAFEELKRMHLAGQYSRVRKRLAEFPEKEASPQTVKELENLRKDYEDITERLTSVAKFLAALPKEVKGDQKEIFTEAATAILAELQPDSYPRLETFLSQARQAERQRQDKMTPDNGPAELLSLAITGWLLGNTAASPRPDHAIRLWKARQLVLGYQRSKDENQRQQLLKHYGSEKTEKATIDEVVQLIPTLPPVDPHEDLTTQPQAMAVGGKGANAVNYIVQLPPEYRHTRSYPVLMLLHKAGEKPKDLIDRFSAAAAENGYILVAPSWGGRGFGATAYGYSETEHNQVLQSLRDVRRHFNIDSDRVFLFGLEQGGDMAFDVGLSHPDLFAGVIPMGAMPEYFGWAYWRNAQYLPFLVINGDHSGDSNAKTRQLFTYWISRGFPSLWTQYKGRGIEWFGAEVTNIFDWMRNKKRVFPLGECGKDGIEFYSMRQSDDRFYWVTNTGVMAQCCNSAGNWNNRIPPSKVYARIDGPTNTIYMKATGTKQVTLWLGKSPRGESMVDFDKPVTVQIGLGRGIAGRKLTPSLETLLEDLWLRGDRQRLFLAKIDINF